MYRMMAVLIALVLCASGASALKVVEQAGLPHGATALAVPENTADYLAIVQKSAAQKKAPPSRTAKVSKAGSGGGGGGSSLLPPPPIVDGQGFAPEIRPLGMFYYFGSDSQEVYVPTLSNEPTVRAANIRGGEWRPMSNAWLVSNRAYPDDGTIGLVYIRTIKNSAVGFDWYTLDLRSFSQVSLSYVVLTETGAVRSRANVRGTVKNGMFCFYYTAANLQQLYLYPGDSLLIGLDALLTTGSPSSGQIHKVYAPCVDLSDGASAVSWEWTPDSGWQTGAPLLPADMDIQAHSGQPGLSQFTLINPEGTVLFGPTALRNEILPGKTDVPIASSIIRGSGQGGLWQITEAVQPTQWGAGNKKATDAGATCSLAGFTDLTITIDGLVITGTRLDRGDGHANWLFDLNQVAFHEMEEKTFVLSASLSPEACADTNTLLFFVAFEVGYWSNWSGILYAPRFMFGDGYFSGLYPTSNSGYVGITLLHKHMPTDPGGIPAPLNNGPKQMKPGSTQGFLNHRAKR